MSATHSIRPCLATLALGLASWLALVTLQASSSHLDPNLPSARAESTLNLFGFAVPGENYVWCLDRSQSMLDDGDVHILKAEMIEALLQLTPANQFSIVTFGSQVESWSPVLVDATPDQVEAAIEFIGSLSADGSTCLISGLGAALDIAEPSTEVVSILLVGDGGNYCGGGSTQTQPSSVVSQVTTQNPSSIPIHCFHRSVDGDSGIPTYTALANAFGGIFVDTATGDGTGESATRFVRADANSDGVVDISDAVVTLQALFQAAVPLCLDAVDSNDDGVTDIADAVFTLAHLFIPSGVTPPSPFPGCGVDPTCDALDCTEPTELCANLEWFLTPILITAFANFDVLANDFDSDGTPDLAVLGSPIHTHLGLGGGAFADIAEFGVGNHLYRKGTTGHFNSDEIADFAALSNLSSAPAETYLTVFLGVGDGTFTTVSPVLVGSDSTWIDRADLNNDGLLDLVTRNLASEEILIHFGLGSGLFGAAVGVNVGGPPQRVQIVDANLDGSLDFASYVDTASSFVVLLGDGSGNFGAPISTGIGAPSFTGGFADFDNDGLIDAVTVTSSVASTRSLEVWGGDGSGGFAPLTTRPVAATTTGIEIGDLNLDGRPDLVSHLSSDVLEYLLNNGDGTFSSSGSVPYDLFGTLLFYKLLDYDGDGDLDVVNRSGSNTVTFTRNLWVP